ncbi:MAG: K+/H+ antiporter subunit F [Betaproteobacteria bacterium HGW-Betaproteobacteria-13]|jgi:multicomponent K+:H+ antiporter subunit F|uniref:K+/H+ antiporter subunit F n=1 Tax=Parazoarcus communis TaxID=41977 RepID=A0A2U8GTL6_9RHOO|nr:K+/H+ antiporter subunit F [Parazoarcus communis]PKO81411.1 MAG: K+/H+ antiporter subunit F [Betaproteobacteria bacterium HGW-Betaproteobacteria-13]PLX75930.1 MAG: K+/H+ antiporter subunit F [Azoarcus sp.]TVT56242.1 MAG: K+/H+ antiporter subunit F [Azoarcus sp. PHD]AWI77059.1 K+/H+ antiporter subunit F [Parazoarcus communis]AWI79802.1 K+/H+ antiporter subunit F [Parazoarcus communis]|tara:strand:+ start:47204 stop:47473 length:270 start_codon:yes stop_codon:yes gene_type:complete
MIEHALTFAFGAISLALLMNLWSVVRGPSILDRVLVVDTMVINVIALIILYGISETTPVYFEAALIFAMYGFVSTVAYAKFVLRGNIIE